MSEEIPANSITFKEFCNLLDALHKKKRHRQEQDKILGKFFSDLKIKASQTVGKKNCTIFPILRLLLVKEEKRSYNLKTTALGAVLVKVLSLSKQSNDARKLLEYRSVNNAQDNDFASVAYFVLRSRVNTSTHTFTIGDINEILDKIASAEAGNKSSIRDEAFSNIINKAGPDQIKWFLRIILKDLKLEMGRNRILALFHPDAPDFYEKCSNLAKVCEELGDGEERPLELGIQIFLPVRPMLSERLDVKNVDRLSGDKAYHIENKFDGERFQMHMENGKFEYFSRRGYPYSSNYGSSYDSGLFTPLLKDCFSKDVTSCILDGEMMGWHKERQSFSSKGNSFDVKKITENSKHRPCYCVFDILYYNGKTLVGPPESGGLPLSARLSVLDKVFVDVPEVILHSERQIVTDRLEVLDALNRAMITGEEGIVVKESKSYYVPNRRHGWYKIKPEYTDGAMSDLDLVIIGADEAEKKKHGRANSFLVACADGDEPGAMPSRWVCVGRVYSGLSHEERETVCATLQKHWTSYKLAPAPAHLVFNKETPDFWILPEHSIVLTVRATELIRSPNFGAAYTLRFPRIMRVRNDKPFQDVMTLSELRQLTGNKGAVVKLSTNLITADQIGIVPRKRKAKAAPEVAEQFKVISSDATEAISKALLGRKIYILSDDEECSRTDLVKIIESHGGKVVASPGPDTFCCIAGKITNRVRAVINSQTEDVCRSTWVRALPPSPIPCTLHPIHMLSTKPSTRLALARHYDAYGDCYTEIMDKEMLKLCLDKMEEDDPIYLTRQEMLDMDKQLFGDNNPFSFLRPCILYIDTSCVTAVVAKMYGATICTEPDHCTHIVLKAIDTGVQRMKTSTKAAVVSYVWLEQCFLQKKLVSEKDFLL